MGGGAPHKAQARVREDSQGRRLLVSWRGVAFEELRDRWCAVDPRTKRETAMNCPTKPLRFRSLPADFRPLARTVLAAGWTIRLTGRTHSLWRSPGGGAALVPLS
jgi:hypothetical protein